MVVGAAAAPAVQTVVISTASAEVLCQPTAPQHYEPKRVYVVSAVSPVARIGLGLRFGRRGRVVASPVIWTSVHAAAGGACGGAAASDT